MRRAAQVVDREAMGDHMMLGPFQVIVHPCLDISSAPWALSASVVAMLLRSDWWHVAVVFRESQGDFVGHVAGIASGLPILVDMRIATLPHVLTHGFLEAFHFPAARVRKTIFAELLSASIHF